MATEEAIQPCLSGVAAADLSTFQYRFVIYDNTGKIAQNTTAGGDCIGVLQNKPSAAGRDAQYADHGVSKVVAGGTFTAGDDLSSDNAGRAISATTGHHIQGYAQEDGVVGQICRVHLVRGAGVA